MVINRKNIWSLSWPLIIANFTIPLVGLTDTIIMGHMPESTYIAAIALGGIVFNFMYAGLNFLRMGTTGIVSQKLGSKDFDEVFLSLLRPLFIALLIGIVLFLSKEFLFNLSVYFLTPDEKLQKLYKEYLFVRMIGLPAGLLNIVFLGWFLECKNKISDDTTYYYQCCNVICSLYLAVVLDYGIFGVALGSVLAQFSGLFMSIIIFSYSLKKLNLITLNFKKFKNLHRFLKLFSISKDLFIRTMLMVSVQAYVIKKAGLIGVDELATIEILLVIFSLSSYSLDAFAHSAESCVGVSIGSQNKRNIYKAIRITTEFALFFSIIFFIVFYLLEFFLISFFTDISALQDLTSELWGLVVITPFISMLAFQLDGIFIGSTLAREMRNCIIFSSLIFFIILEYWFESNLDLKGLYSCFLLFLISRGIFLTMYLPRVFNLVKLDRV